ncbi:MAG TPA: crotonase/enoyl-CoA hydratase family protein [Acidimicrobiales bacterium]|nr:crotonase/enoyl-CoA hydratase family protein [Acidimicrobiales bacterium]
MSDRVTYTVDGGVADVRLNRPDKINALDPAMFEALVDTGEALKNDPAVRAVVLSGEGRGFCAGLDFGSFQQMASSDRASVADLTRREGRIANRGQQAAYVWFEMPAPVVAAVHGPCLGGGFQIAMACDIRIVAPDVKMSVLEVRWGLSPDMTGTQLLPRVVGLDVAKELTFTGRMVEGEEAVRIGLATRVSDSPRDDALALAHEVAGKSPGAVKGAKALLNLAGTVSLEEGFKAEERTIKGLIGTPNQVEAVTAYFEKRAPNFDD